MLEILPTNVHVIRHNGLKALGMRARKCTDFGPAYKHCIEQMGAILAAETTRNIPVTSDSVDMGGLGVYEGVNFNGRTALVPILRAGIGLLRPFEEVLPCSCMWQIDIRREEETAEAKFRGGKVHATVPADVQQVYILDPMLATGGSAVMAINFVKNIPTDHPIKIIFVGILGCKQGYEHVLEHHPDVEIYLAELAPGLNEVSFLLKGYQDIGNNITGTIC